jgi:hypothetical protein
MRALNVPNFRKLMTLSVERSALLACAIRSECSHE